MYEERGENSQQPLPAYGPFNGTARKSTQAPTIAFCTSAGSLRHMHACVPACVGITRVCGCAGDFQHRQPGCVTCVFCTRNSLCSDRKRAKVRTASRRQGPHFGVLLTTVRGSRTNTSRTTKEGPQRQCDHIGEAYRGSERSDLVAPPIGSSRRLQKSGVSCRYQLQQRNGGRHSGKQPKQNDSLIPAQIFSPCSII